MSEPTRLKDPAALWKEQPEEKTSVTLENIVNRRAGELHASTRSEILMSIGAALLLVAVTLLRFNQLRSTLPEIGCGLVLVWIGITVYRLRDRIWQAPMRPDAAAATGAEHYRRELVRRRDHLRDAWLWHGPLLLACAILAGVWSGWSFAIGFHGGAQQDRVIPLLLLLLLWTVYGIRRRLAQARELQKEIDELRRQ